MKTKGGKILGCIKKYYFLLFAAVALLLPDALLRSLTPESVFWEAYVPVVSWLFTALWGVFILILCVFVLPKTAGRIVYIVWNAVFIILAVCQYIYFKIFEQFFWIKSVMLADEVGDYLGFVFEQVDARLIVSAVLAVLCLTAAAVLWKTPVKRPRRWWALLLVPVLLLASVHIYMLPEVHGDKMNDWDSWRKPRIVYKRLNDVNKSFKTAGLYQLTVRDITRILFGGNELDESELEKVDMFFTERGEYGDNQYTGLFKGKNVIAVMLESVDTWMIDKEYTPTLYKMMQSGINFTNYNAPFFGAGFTFSSEFAFNTGFFTPVSAVSASNFSTNSFPYSMANLFKKEGYALNSFHFNSPEFYNRGIMHKSFGYEKYHAITDFGIPAAEAELDSSMMKNDELYAKMTEKTPFCNFIITYSAHLPYNTESGKMALAKEYYPELIDENEPREKNNAMILAKDTDEFFRLLLERLEEDGLLDDTVIIAYTDHFAYGLSDSELLAECKGDDITYRVPAFIYAKGMKNNEVSKPMMTVDWLPTIANLFGLDKSGKYIGNDVLAPENPGFAYFETSAWMDDRMHYIPKEEHAFSPEEEVYIAKQSERVRASMEVNDIIVLGDYYKDK